MGKVSKTLLVTAAGIMTSVLKTSWTVDFEPEVEGVTVEERWKGMGNCIYPGVLAHVAVSVLVTKGYITRDDVRLSGQPWTIS